jgi:hypothetical protein
LFWISGEEEFLNYMDDKGYEIFKVLKDKYGGEYTFKKK